MGTHDNARVLCLMEHTGYMFLVNILPPLGEDSDMLLCSIAPRYLDA